MELLCREKPKFTGFDVWPPNSPDIKPVDYLMQEQVYHTSIQDVAGLRQRVMQRGLSVVDEAVDQRQKIRCMCSYTRSLQTVALT